MTPPRFGLWIHGKQVETDHCDTIRNPFTGELVAEACLAGESELEQALQSTMASFPVVRELTRGKRAAILHNLAEGIRSHQEELTLRLVQETGKPIDACITEIQRTILTITLSAEEATRNTGELVVLDLTEANRSLRGMYERFPIGPVAAITPFNFPLNLSAHKIGPAFAAGNSVILKPPVQCPSLMVRFAEIAQAAGLPDGALNVIHCHPPLAEKLVTDERIKLLSFTGSAAVGWRLKRLAGKKKVLLELGGNAAAIVHADANVSRAAARLALGAFYQSGQVCISVQRIWIHKTVADEFIHHFIPVAQALPIGDPMKSGTIIGPMINETEAQRVETWVNEAQALGAKVLLKGKRDRAVLSPIVLTQVPPQAKIACEEVFGPVAVIETYEDFDEALAQVNTSRYGLQASVFTNDVRLIDRAFRTLEVGGVIVNDYPNLRTDNFPYGGVKDSGQGREGVRYTLAEMTEMKMLVINTEA